MPELNAEQRLRDLTSRLGFGDGITEPMADNDTIVEFVDLVTMEASEHRECPIVCELCGERLAATICEHCHGSGGNRVLIEATLAYSECEWCAGAGKVHVGCGEHSYADPAEAQREAAQAVLDAVEAAMGTPADTPFRAKVVMADAARAAAARYGAGTAAGGDGR